MKDKLDLRAAWLARHVLPHEPGLRAWLQRRSAPLEVDDVVQETYAILAGLESVEEIANPRAYMFTVAYSVIQRHLRHARIVRIDAMGEIDRLSILGTEPSPEQSVSDREELRRIARLVAELPAKCREAFVMRKVEGLPQREIARQMGVSEGTVEKHVAKAIRFLMDAVGKGSEPGNVAKGAKRTDRRHRR